jgi:hypothetical protein
MRNSLRVHTVCAAGHDYYCGDGMFEVPALNIHVAMDELEGKGIEFL